MFARTRRLMLRPAWPEDAPALAQAIGHESIAQMLGRVPFPYALADAESFCARPCGAETPRLLITALDAGAPRLIGGIGLSDWACEEDEGAANIGYWLTPAAWDRGYATEAGFALIATARHALPLRRLRAEHFVDNPASGAVLRKLGFRATGGTVMRRSAARAEAAAMLEYELDLEEGRSAMPLAA